MSTIKNTEKLLIVIYICIILYLPQKSHSRKLIKSIFILIIYEEDFGKTDWWIFGFSASLS